MARPRGFRRAPIRSRRKTSWGVGPGDPDTVPGALSASGSVIVGAGISLSNEEQATIVRIRGYFEATLLTASAAGEGFLAAVGIGIVTGDAFTVGITAMPTPVTDENWDGWLWHNYFSVRAPTATIADVAGRGSAHFRTPIDSKAMRILHSDNVLFMALQVTEVGTSSMDFSAATRLLLKLP